MKNAAVLDVSPSQKIYLSIENLWKKFGDFVALREISLEVIESEFLCFLGPSGCGKTTLLRAIAGLDLQTIGTGFLKRELMFQTCPLQNAILVSFSNLTLFFRT